MATSRNPRSAQSSSPKWLSAMIAEGLTWEVVVILISLVLPVAAYGIRMARDAAEEREIASLHQPSRQAPSSQASLPSTGERSHEPAPDAGPASPTLSTSSTSTPTPTIPLVANRSPARIPVSASPPAQAVSAPAAASPAPQPIAVAFDPSVEKLLADAWGLVERDEHDLGRRVLLDARRMGKGDLRIDFSLGLVESLALRDWPAAEKRFAECVRQQPEEVASLNNWSLTRLRIHWDRHSLRPWETILAQGPPPPEVLQNLGRVRHLAKSGRMPDDPTLLDAVEQLYLKAAIDTGQSFQPQTGFLYMDVKLADGRKVGWSNAGKFEDSWCMVCGGEGHMRCTNPGCIHGMVRQPKSQGGGRATCDKCRGTGRVVCPACFQGKDKDLKSAPASSPTGRSTGSSRSNRPAPRFITPSPTVPAPGTPTGTAPQGPQNQPANAMLPYRGR